MGEELPYFPSSQKGEGALEKVSVAPGTSWWSISLPASIRAPGKSG